LGDLDLQLAIEPRPEQQADAVLDDEDGVADRALHVVVGVDGVVDNVVDSIRGSCRTPDAPSPASPA